jgi:hypothetical protein
VVGRALDHQQQQIALRCQTRRASVALRNPQEPPQRGPELGYPCSLFDCERLADAVSLGEFVGVLLVVGVRWPFRGKDAGSPCSGCYRGD